MDTKERKRRIRWAKLKRVFKIGIKVFAIIITLVSFVLLIWFKYLSLTIKDNVALDISCIILEIIFPIFGIGLLLDLSNSKKLSKEVIEEFVEITTEAEFVKKNFSKERAIALYDKAYNNGAVAKKQHGKHISAIGYYLEHLLCSVYAKVDKATVEYNLDDEDENIIIRDTDRTFVIVNPNKEKHRFNHRFGFVPLPDGKEVDMTYLKIGEQEYTPEQISKLLTRKITANHGNTSGTTSYEGESVIDVPVKPSHFDKDGECTIHYKTTQRILRGDEVYLITSKYLVEAFEHTIIFHDQKKKFANVGLVSVFSFSKSVKQSMADFTIADFKYSSSYNTSSKDLTYCVSNNKEAIFPGDGFCIKYQK